MGALNSIFEAGKVYQGSMSCHFSQRTARKAMALPLLQLKHQELRGGGKEGAAAQKDPVENKAPSL